MLSWPGVLLMRRGASAASWHRCPARPVARPDIRSFPYRGDVIFFRYTGDTFEAVNVLHGRRDIDAYFDNRRQ
jgi:plasmid stabilization system protein ParE